MAYQLLFFSKNSMSKKELLIAAAVAAGLATYFILRKKYANANRHPETANKPEPRTHHLTNVFANAKHHALN
jgi:hypothetical protein